MSGLQVPSEAAYLPPSGAKLGKAQREPFGTIANALVAANYDPATVDGLMAGFVNTMTSICTSDDDQHQMIEELGDWVRWKPLGSYYLTFAFQSAMKALNSPSFMHASLLFADAQNHFAEDLSLHSLENAYLCWTEHRTAGGANAADADALNALGEVILARLRMTYRYYQRWYSADSYAKINPISESLYFERPWNDLRQAFPDQKLARRDPDVAVLQAIVDRCAAQEHAYCRVIARRHLGFAHAAAGDYAAAEEAYHAALDDAKAVRLDAEIGHLHRLRGWALMKLSRYDDADLEHRKAFTHDANPRLSYWQAITFGELGEVRMRKGGDAGDAFSQSRSAFEEDVSRAVFPIARSIKQQMMRSYADSAVEIAADAGPQELLAAIETFGPRYANDVVTEGSVAAEAEAAGYARFRKARAIVHGDLATLAISRDEDPAKAFEASLECYLDHVVTHRSERRFYLETRKALGSRIAAGQSSSAIVERTAALRIPGRMLLLLNVARAQTHALLIDASTGGAAASVFAPLGTAGWQEPHDAYVAAVADGAKGAQSGIDPAPAMRRALDELLAFYQTSLGGLFEQFAELLEGKHLTIFPRFLMNQVPLHALHVKGKRLIDLCEVSYAPSLTLWLQLRESLPVPAADAGTSTTPAQLTIVHDAARTRAYGGTLRALGAQPGANIAVVPGPTWENLKSALAQPPRDILFACHGSFDPDDPAKSRLELTRREAVEFSQLFEELDLRGCRSVFMGACESGLGRTLVSAEYIGLPVALLGNGVRSVVGTLWQVTQLPAAILVASFYELLLPGGKSPAYCLNEAARRLKTMSRDQVMAWVRQFLPDKVAEVEGYLRGLGDPPFDHPYYWAGFYVSGDA